MNREPTGYLTRNGPYWKVVVRYRGQQLRTASIGRRDQLTERQATRRMRQIEAEVVDDWKRGRLPIDGPGDSRAPTLGDYLAEHMAHRTDIGDSTRALYEQCRAYLTAHFGTDRRIDEIEGRDAMGWRAALAAGKIDGQPKPPAEATVAKHVRTAKKFFGDAVKPYRYLADNPFDGIPSTPPEREADYEHRPLAEFDAVLEQCPNVRWQAFFGLCRLAGLRRGEALRLTWAQVDMLHGRLTVLAAEGKRTTKQRRRIVPIEPALAKILQRRFDAAEPGEQHVVGLADSTTLNRTARRILKRAWRGFDDAPFQSLRRMRDTDWKQQFAEYVVDVWMGHSMAVSRKHYLSVPDDVMARAAGRIEQPHPQEQTT